MFAVQFSMSVTPPFLRRPTIIPPLNNRVKHFFMFFGKIFKGVSRRDIGGKLGKFLGNGDEKQGKIKKNRGKMLAVSGKISLSF